MESVSSKGMYVCETNGRPIRKHIYVLGRLVSTMVLLPIGYLMYKSRTKDSMLVILGSSDSH